MCIAIAFSHGHVLAKKGSIWRFPKLGVPPDHPFLDGNFPSKPSNYWGTPMAMEPPQGSFSEDMMKEAWLLCFDEFQVTHISDAIIMKRIFSVLFELGAVVVATSNRPPQDLRLGERAEFVART